MRLGNGRHGHRAGEAVVEMGMVKDEEAPHSHWKMAMVGQSLDFDEDPLAHCLQSLRESVASLEKLLSERLPFPLPLGFFCSASHHVELLSQFDFHFLLALSSS